MSGKSSAAAGSVLALLVILTCGRVRAAAPSGPNQAPAAAPSLPAAAPASAPAPALDLAAYNQRMLALANLKPPRHCAPRGARTGAPAPSSQPPAPAPTGPNPPRARRVARRAAPRLRPCPAPLWPARTVPPAAGALLPFHRIVAYYGNFYSTHMGILGAYPPTTVLAKLQAQAAAWTEADPETPVLRALDYIAVAAQNTPGRDRMYRLRMPSSQIQKALGMADQIHGLLFLDVQPGWSTVQSEVPRLAPYLQLPNVELALDPEFDLPPDGKRPGQKRGAMSAAEINFAARFLAGIVLQYHLPPKVLVIHRFSQRMVTDYRAIRPLPQVQIVMDMDGFGSPSFKTAAYDSFIASQPVQFAGFKFFYFNDVHYGRRLMTPREVLALSPRPIYIVYQ